MQRTILHSGIAAASLGVAKRHIIPPPGDASLKTAIVYDIFSSRGDDMRFISVNSLSDFEFHDAQFSLDVLDHNLLRVKANYLNIHKNTEQNSHETDMEIASAFITFEGFNLLSYEPGRAWQRDENGKFCSTEPQIILTDDSAFSRFLEQLESGITIFDLGIKEEFIYFIDALSKDPFFTVCFTFRSVRIEWDEYKKEAWYTSAK